MGLKPDSKSRPFNLKPNALPSELSGFDQDDTSMNLII